MPTHTAIDRIVRDIHDLMQTIGRPVTLMEVCGTHTMAIHRHGLAAMMPDGLRLRSGPGCPVCVTPSGYVDCAIELARTDGVTVATFGDMVRVPGSQGTLEVARAEGGRVVVVQSPLEAVGLARAEPDIEVVFLAIGFETTAPTIAAAILEAERGEIRNFRILPSGKLVPPALRALLEQPELGLDGLLLPGHVTTIIGLEPYEFIPHEFGIPCSVAGFEPGDIVPAVRELVDMIRADRNEVVNSYTRVVQPAGNPRAREVMDRVFEPAADLWRGFGPIGASGLVLRDEYRTFDVCTGRGVSIPVCFDPLGCRCGDVVRGLIDPDECSLFGTACTPDHPVGPCMVSSEGTCAAHFKYGSGTFS